MRVRTARKPQTGQSRIPERVADATAGRAGPGAQLATHRLVVAHRGLGACVVAAERRIARLLHELVEERAVVLHRAAQVLGRPLAHRARPRQRVTLAIVLDDARMVDRDVGRALLEVVHRVAAVAHHRLNQHVGVVHRDIRVVDELRLYAAPLGDVSLARGRSQRPDLELAAPVAALASGPKSHAAAAATSAGSRSRFTAWGPSRSSSVRSSSCASTREVRTYAGQSAEAEMPTSAPSRASTFTRPITPCFAAT